MSEQAWRWWTDRLAFGAALKAVDEQYGESRDGNTCADHDAPYTYPHPHAVCPWPFTERQFGRLLVLRGRFLNHEIRGDTFASEWPVEEP